MTRPALKTGFNLSCFFPVLVLFVYDQPNKELLEFRYPSGEDFTADNLKNWMRRKSGIYLPLPGCLEQFDKLADRLMETFKYDSFLEIFF
jgi:endoplasmic reticulum protein 29